MRPSIDYNENTNNSLRLQQTLASIEAFSTSRQNALHSTRYQKFKDVAGNLFKKAASSLAASYSGIPQVSPILNNILNKNETISTVQYSTSPFNQLNNIPGLAFNDFRSRKSKIALGTSADIRLDGTAASIAATTLLVTTNPIAQLKSFKGAIYAAASAAPGGVYNVFNINSFGKFGYGWGSHGDPNGLRFDFTLRSHISTGWDALEEKWRTGYDPLKKLIPFRGDKVNAIDARPRQLVDAYRWSSPILDNTKSAVGRFLGNLGETNDFIKFYFTGPKLAPFTKNFTDGKYQDDIIVFRATIDSVNDTFSPQWSPISMLGRADQNYHYTSFSRELNLDFSIYATDRDELKPIYRKLNALAGYTTPDYSAQNSIGLIGPWMRITIGDLFYQVPAVISSLSYTLGDSESPWEINIEDDPENMQVPHRISVSISFSIITDWLPEKGGQFYSLSKRFDEFGSKKGNDNWLSDSTTAKKRPPERDDDKNKQKQENNNVSKNKNTKWFKKSTKDVG